MFHLDGKTAIITGAASGIGAAIAETFAAAGARVIIADCDASGAEREASRLRQSGRKASACAIDVTSATDCAALQREVEKNYGSIDVLVNNAGIGAVGTIFQTTSEDLDRLYAVNVRGIFNVTKVFLPGMVQRKSGNIINMASIGGVVGIRDRLAYCTTKFAVVGLTKSLALDHGAEGIRVNCICPGRVETPFVQARLREYPDPAAAYQEMASTQLFGRMILPAEIAAAALYLASDESQMVTGTAFLVDGGWSAGK